MINIDNVKGSTLEEVKNDLNRILRKLEEDINREIDMNNGSVL